MTDHRRPSHLNITGHAWIRFSQRNLSVDDIQYVISHGQCIHVPDAVAYFLGRRNIPCSDRHNDKITRLEGTTVILEDETVITAYRNRRCPPKRQWPRHRR